MTFIYKYSMFSIVFRMFSVCCSCRPRSRSGILRWMPCCFPTATRSPTRATAPCWRTCGRASASVALWHVPIGPCPDSRWSQETMGKNMGKLVEMELMGWRLDIWIWWFDDWKNLGVLRFLWSCIPIRDMGMGCGTMGKGLPTLAFLFAKLPNHNNGQPSVGFYNEFSTLTSTKWCLKV